MVLAELRQEYGPPTTEPLPSGEVEKCQNFQSQTELAGWQQHGTVMGTGGRPGSLARGFCPEP